MRVFTVSFAVSVYEGESFTSSELAESIAQDVVKALDEALPVCGVSDLCVHEVTRLVELVGRKENRFSGEKR